MISSQQLSQLKVFKEVPMAALEELVQGATPKIFSQGEKICQEGEKGAGLYLILSGLVSVEKSLFEGNNTTKVVARLGKEEFFGEMSFLQNQPYSATVVAQEETTVLLFSRTALDELSKKDSKVALDQVLTIMTGLSDRLRSTTRELVTVFDVARVIGLSPVAEELAEKVVGQLSFNLSTRVSISFYRWNPFNEEYMKLTSVGDSKSLFPDTLEVNCVFNPKIGTSLFSPIDLMGAREGALLYHLPSGEVFSSGEKQMIQTVSAVLAPALATARLHEEEMAREKFRQTKERGGY